MKQAVTILTIFFVFIALLGGGYYFVTVEQPIDFHGAQKIQNALKKGAISNSTMLSGNASHEIIVEVVPYTDGSAGYYVYPSGTGTYPGVVMVHEWWGLNDHIREMARVLAGDGYRVLAVDLYNGKVAATSSEAQQLRNSVTKEQTTKNLRDGTRFLRDRGSEKIASLGWCYGGGKSLELALSGEPLDATVIYYGALSTSTAELTKIKWPVLGIFGAEDKTIPVATVSEFDAALDTLGITNSIHIYPGVGHAFANPSGANYARNETKDAWTKTLEFLQATLK